MSATRQSFFLSSGCPSSVYLYIMYRKQYKSSNDGDGGEVISPQIEILTTELNNAKNSSNDGNGDGDFDTRHHSFLYGFQNSGSDLNAKAEQEINSKSESIVKATRRKSCDVHLHTFKNIQRGRLTHDKRLNSLSLDDSRKSCFDPYISIQEGISSESRTTPYQTSVRKTKRFVEYRQHQQKQGKTTKRAANSVIPQLQRKSIAPSSDIGEAEEDGDAKNHCIRRCSSLSSIPPYFYPDPYSILLSRYVEDLGSLSPYSSAGGSQATEYLHLSQAPSLTCTPEATKTLIETERLSETTETSENNTYFLLETLIAETVIRPSFEDNMNFDSALSTSEEYQSFRSSVPLKKICVESDGSKEWKVYDAGPRSVRTPLLCLGPASATADVFYRQMLNLTARGIRVISVEGPIYWTVDDWCKGLKKLLDCLNIDKVHIFGASLGGFLAQKFAEYTYHYPRVASVILCNTFLDTSIFDYHDTAMIFWMLPSVILKKLIVQNITTAKIMDLEIAHAIEFMLERLNHISQQELASRMTLNCVNSHVDTFKLKQIKMTIMDVFDDSALSSQAREDMYGQYTDAKLAHLKSGGNFPYLSRSDEVNMHLMVHLRAFHGTKHSAQLEEGNVRKKSNTVVISRPVTRQTNGSSVSKKSAEDILGPAVPTLPPSMPTSSLIDENKEIKEQAANLLGLPVQ